MATTNDIDRDRIVSAIEALEERSSCELRVHLESKCPREDPRDRATELFAALGMHKTKLRNGVLMYLALKSRRFAIIGDAGINRVLPEGFWDMVRDNCGHHFAAGHISEGICAAIAQIGAELEEHFPAEADDVNELPNEISGLQ